jgi:uncharacterized protein YjdB
MNQNFVTLFRKIQSFVFLFFLFFTINAFTQTFKHPGLFQTKEELDFVKAKITANAEPWKTAYNDLKSSVSFSYTPKPLTIPQSQIESDRWMTDSSKAYDYAMLWYLSGDQRYADNAIKIFNAWNIFVGGNTWQLNIQWGLADMLGGAEIILYSNAGWKAEDVTKFKQMLRNNILPVLLGRPEWLHNAQQTNIRGLMMTYVFLDDRNGFNDELTEWRKYTPIYIATDGTTNETCRDGNHVNYGVEGTLQTAQIAYVQGVDLWAEQKVRLSNFMKLYAGWYTFTNGVRDIPIPSTICSNVGGSYHPGLVPCGGRPGSFAWHNPPCPVKNTLLRDKAYTHLAVRLEMNIPFAAKYNDMVRPAYDRMCLQDFTNGELITSGNNTTISVTSVSISPTNFNLTVGQTSQLNPVVLPNNATNKSLTYVSSNTIIASVSATGLVKGLANGSATITIKTVDGNKIATTSVTVTTVTTAIAVTGISLTPVTVSLNIGQTKQLTPAVLPTNATNKSVTYSSANTSVATVNTTGLVTAIANGSATITVKTVEGNKTATATITVTTPPPTSCSFGAPTTAVLPAINTNYTKMYVFGTGGPNLSNFREFQINWDLGNNGLYVFAYSTKNGVPDYYNDLKSKITQNFNATKPGVTIINSGIGGLDGAYWVTKKGSDFVMVSKTQGYTLYFSNVNTAPYCGSNISSREIATKNLLVFPNPAKESITISGIDEIGAKVSITDLQGNVLVKSTISAKETTVNTATLKAGTYIVTVEGTSIKGSTLLNIKE